MPQIKLNSEDWKKKKNIYLYKHKVWNDEMEYSALAAQTDAGHVLTQL